MLKQQVLWLAVVMVGVLALTVAPILAQQIYSDPNGLFSTEIPEGWNNESTDEFGLYTSDGASVYLVIAESSEVQAGIEKAVQSIAPSFDAAPIASNELPLPNGVWTQNVYAYPDGALDVALAQVRGETTYVIFFMLESQAVLAAKQNDVNNILFNASVGEVVDLSDAQPAALTDALLDEIGRYVNTTMAQYGIYGAAVAIVQNGEIVYSEGFGTLARDDETPVNDETLFMIGSTTKSMTTLMTATLVDDGVIDWDTLVTDVLPDFSLSDSAATDEIAWRDLFNMSSGLSRYDIPMSLEALTPEDVQAEIAMIPLSSQPGEVYGYSNLMVALGGFADAVATGADLNDAAAAYEDLLEARVFEPIGMERTTVDIDTALEDPNHALPHTEDQTLNEIVPLDVNIERMLISVAPAGAVWSNAEEMGRYLVTQMNGGVTPDGERIVSQESLFETWTPAIEMGAGTSYGMGLMIADYRGQRMLHHGGNTGGFTTDFAFLPDAGLGVVVLSNVALANSFTSAVREQVFETAFGLEHTADAYYAASEAGMQALFDQALGSVDFSDKALVPEAVEAYLGEYERGVELVLDGEGNLFAETEFIDYPLAPTTDPEEFASTGLMSGYLLTFDDDDGKISVTIESLLGPYLGEPQSLTLEKISE